jgi:DNA-binding response OmpR family regulator
MQAGLKTTDYIKIKGRGMAAKNILCIEDDRFIGEMYVRTLERAGYKVDWVIDGNDGLVTARNKKYDIILLDIMLPERKGNEILEALRGKEDLIPDTKVIVMTNFQQDEQSRRMLELKVDAYLIKADITPAKLLEVVKHVEEG